MAPYLIALPIASIIKHRHMTIDHPQDLLNLTPSYLYRLSTLCVDPSMLGVVSTLPQ
jgi:hypothetical protein